MSKETNVEQLKKLATTLTGIEEVNGETIADVIGFINDNYTGGGSSGGGSSNDEAIIEQIDEIIRYCVNNDYKYEAYIGTSKTIVEALEKLNEIVCPTLPLYNSRHATSGLWYFSYVGVKFGGSLLMNVVNIDSQGSSVNTSNISDGKLLLCEFEGDINGLLVCRYKFSSGEYKTGTLEFSGGKLSLIPMQSSDLPSSNATITVEATGVVSESGF